MKKSRVEKIVARVKARCRKLGVKLVLDHRNEHLDGDRSSESSAYFTHTPIPLIKVSTVRRTHEVWICNLLHELAHAEQWKKNTLEWQECFIDGVDVTEIINLWVKGTVELTYDQRRNVFKRLQRLELAAEIQTISKIRKYNLDDVVSVDEYIRQAWAYISGYLVTAITRRWIPGHRPSYTNRQIVMAQPKTMDMLDGYSRIIAFFAHPKRETALFLEHYPQLFYKVTREDWGPDGSIKFPKRTLHASCHRISS
jgi:hypothetical protein